MFKVVAIRQFLGSNDNSLFNQLRNDHLCLIELKSLLGLIYACSDCDTLISSLCKKINNEQYRTLNSKMMFHYENVLKNECWPGDEKTLLFKFEQAFFEKNTTKKRKFSS